MKGLILNGLGALGTLYVVRMVWLPEVHGPAVLILSLVAVAIWIPLHRWLTRTYPACDAAATARSLTDAGFTPASVQQVFRTSEPLTEVEVEDFRKRWIAVHGRTELGEGDLIEARRLARVHGYGHWVSKADYLHAFACGVRAGRAAAAHRDAS